MAYIKTGVNQPGIVELLFYKGSTGKALSNLAHTLMHGPSSLSPGQREMIASYVSQLNDCEYCQHSHAASANSHFEDGGDTMNCVFSNIETAPISQKMKRLLDIASKVSRSGRSVTSMDVKYAKEAGASDEDIHDAVLIASAFCMYNRYVDGLGTSKPQSFDEYNQMGYRMSTVGYKYPPRFLRKWVVRIMNKRASE